VGLSGWYSTNILGNREARLLDEPRVFKTKEERRWSWNTYCSPSSILIFTRTSFIKVGFKYYPPRAINERGWDNIDI